MRIVLDSNLYISAFLSEGGLASKVLELCEEGKLEIYCSPDIIEETQTRLVNKLKLDEDYVASYIKHIASILKIVVPQKGLKVVKADPDDDKVIECAVEAQANLIVTMDKHLLKLKSYEKIGIIHPKTLTWILPKVFEKN